MKKRILYIVPHRLNRAPSQRFRFEQYLGVLNENEFETVVSFLMNEKEDKVFYSPGNYILKGAILFKMIFKRLLDVFHAGDFDIILIHREAFFMGPAIFESLFKSTRAKIIFDFDDSIWLSNVSEANKKFSVLKSPQKTAKIIRMSDLVIAGNAYLEKYALQYNSKVMVIPTTINTDEYQPVAKNTSNPICIGWSGSITTIKHFQYALPFLKTIKLIFGDKVSIKVIGDASYTEPDIEIQSLAWNKATEIEELQKFDIGIMPLPDDEWAMGKCGLKGLQYMALGIPTLMSPVGVNAEIIQNGINGFLPKSNEEWVSTLTKLIESETLRKKIGAAARETVVNNYSVNAWKEKYLQLFNRL